MTTHLTAPRNGPTLDDTFLEIHGPPEGECVVLVPGATLPSEVWASLIDPLVLAGYRVVSYDLPGRGESSVASREADFEGLLAQLQRVVARASPRAPVHLVALALGAVVGAAFALRFPQLVKRVCFFAPDGVDTAMTAAERLVRVPLVGELVVLAFARRLLLRRVPRYSASHQHQQTVAALLEKSLGNRAFGAALLRTLRTVPFNEGESFYRELGRLPIPVLAVLGGDDGITPPANAGLLRSAFGDENVVILQGVGHLPFLEAPTLVARLLERFLSSGERPAVVGESHALLAHELVENGVGRSLSDGPGE